MNTEEWKNFKGDTWKNEINVKDFIVNNYDKYDGNESFLAGVSNKTSKVWSKCEELLKKELGCHVLDIDTDHMSGINAFKPGYICPEDDVIVGLQTDAPLKRIVNPYGGIRMVYEELEAYNYKLNKDVDKYFNEFRKSHNEGVFDAYTEDIRKARHVGLLTGLPDAYGRGRIIGDYRRIALYGIDYLIEDKKKDLDNLKGEMLDDLIRSREEVSMQIKALNAIKEMGLSYGIDMSKPAKNAKEAIQFTYLGYLAGVKENNGAAMSMGRVDAFFDIYLTRDIASGILTEEEAQELIDNFVIKLRLVRHLRTPEYDELFSGDPTWVTCSIGGLTEDGKSMVTKTSYRIVHTLTNLNTAPEPNITILWSKELPETFKKYVAGISIDTDAIQYENDDLMRPIYGCDYGIACCVSAMRLGKDMQFFGARCNLAKSLLLSLNKGIDERMKVPVIEGVPEVNDEVLNYDSVIEGYKKVLHKVAGIYSDAMNIIHYMHDKYAYEAGQMALHDTDVHRYMAYGVAGLSVAVDSLSAIKYAKVSPIRDADGITTDFKIEGDYPKYGNDDDRVDQIAVELVKYFKDELASHKTYRDAEVTMSVLTITSNVVYGSKTGSTPDGRKAGIPFAPGANPMHGRDTNGAIASLNSVAKLPYERACKDGISNTFSIIPNALGMNEEERKTNLVTLLDGYFSQMAHHLNVNVLNRETLIDAMNNPEKYPLLTIRVSGYAVHFNRLTRKQQEEVISRTFHEKI
ncbi:MAG TPA: formate C-acetyltransferase [Bacilli bacterium]|jgi:formate C-acetyltransferase|nr:formate C-acetyltransferase [Bacilli bacterium]